MNPNRMDLSKVFVTRKNLQTGATVKVAGAEAIRAMFPMKSAKTITRDKTLYHRVSYPAVGQSELELFQQYVGQSGVTFAVTNLQKAGEMRNNRDFVCEGISIIALPAAATEANKLLDLAEVLNAGARLIINDEDGEEVFADGPLRNFVYENDLIGINTTGGNKDGKGQFYRLANPFTIEAGQAFGSKLAFYGTAPTPTDAVELIVRLHGQEVRAAVKR